MRIGELALEVGVEASTIRYYESAGVLPEPRRTSAGYRTYGPDDVRHLRLVVSARSLRLGLDEIRQLLGVRDSGDEACGCTIRLIGRTLRSIDQRIDDLLALQVDFDDFMS